MLALLILFVYAKSKDDSSGYENGIRGTAAMEEAVLEMEDGYKKANFEGPEEPTDFVAGADYVDEGVEATEAVEIEKRERKNADLSLKVADIENALSEIKKVAGNNKGEVFSSYIESEIKNRRRGSVTVKVPVENFEKTITEIKESALQVLSEETTSDDVTAEFVDLEARLKNKKEEEQAFSQLLSRATNNQDLLDTTRELARVRGEIESLEGRKRYLASQTDMSVINVGLREEEQVVAVGDGWRPVEVIKGSFNGLIQNLQNLIDWLIRFAIIDLPVLILLGIVLLIAIWVGKKIYRKVKK